MRAVLKFGASVIGTAPVAQEVLREARERFPDLDLQVSIGTIPENILALNRRALDVVYAYLPFDSPRTPRYLRLGVIEHLLAIPERHRLASMEWVPREELVNERFVIGSKGLNPPAAEEVFRSLFGTSLPPNPVETSDAGTNRFKPVSEGVGIGVVGFPMEALLPIRGVVYRRVADPSPTIEYGFLWFDDSPSPALPAFVEFAREIARKNPPPANGRFGARDLVSDRTG